MSSFTLRSPTFQTTSRQFDTGGHQIKERTHLYTNPQVKFKISHNMVNKREKKQINTTAAQKKREKTDVAQRNENKIGDI